VPAVITIAGFVGLVELTSFRTIGATQGKELVLFGSSIDVNAPQPWLIATALLLVGGAWAWHEAKAFRRVWDTLNDDLKPAR
jgi:branched-chain amino acid transport system permease protein